MAVASFSFVLIFLLSLVSFPHFLNASIYDACTKAAALSPNINRDFCVTSLQVIPKCASATYVDLAQIAIKLASKNATSTIAKIQNLLAKPGNGHNMTEVLGTCLELYSQMINDLSAAASAIRSSHCAHANRSFQCLDANIRLTGASDAPVTCEDSFSEMSTASVLAEEDANAEQLSEMAIAFISI